MRIYKCDAPDCNKEYEEKRVSRMYRERNIEGVIKDNTFEYYDFCSNSCFAEWFKVKVEEKDD
jgi:hypothetical protein